MILNNLKSVSITKSRFTRIARTDLFFVLVFSAINFAIRIYRFKYPIFEFRQTQTAFGVRSILRNDMSILGADIPVLGPPWKIPLEFPLYQYISAIASRITGAEVVYASLLTASLIFTACGVATFYLLRMTIGSGPARIALGIFFFSSFGLFHGTSVRIDFTSVLFFLIAMIALIKFLVIPRIYLMAFIFLFASLGALTKITTAIPWVFFGMLPLMFLSNSQVQTKVKLSLVLFASFVPTLIWNRYADSIKSENTHTRFLMSENLYEWNFGTIKQRTDMKLWQHLFDHFFGSTIGNYYLVFLFVLIALFFSQHQKMVWIFVAIFVSGPAIFANLYLVHDYYAIAVFPALVAVIAVAICALSESLKTHIRSNHSRLLPLLASVFLIILSWTSSEGIENMNSVVPRELIRPFPEFDEIKEFTNSDDYLLVINPDWDPTLLFLVDRKGLMLRPDGTRPTVSELGTTYRFVYWEQIKPTKDDWNFYFPENLKFKVLSDNFFEIFPIES